ncbi:hypothetical protein ACN4EG_17400 [Alkalinema pantanalense CENA528]|uniref:hypothetical protein n=1 Tax=Alkalinema pantanalense TaxID=1620705 RepID=UPI003D6ED08B
MESTQQEGQRKYTQLCDWLYGDEAKLQQLLRQEQTGHPEKDYFWCVNQVWGKYHTWRMDSRFIDRPQGAIRK